MQASIEAEGPRSQPVSQEVVKTEGPRSQPVSQEVVRTQVYVAC